MGCACVLLVVHGNASGTLDIPIPLVPFVDWFHCWILGWAVFDTRVCLIECEIIYLCIVAQQNVNLICFCGPYSRQLKYDKG